MDRYRKLAYNSIVFAIGNLGSKLISLILVPLYTYYLSTSQYGTVDLMTTTLGMLLPIFTVSIADAVLRYVMDKEYENRMVLNNALFITLIGFFMSILMFPVFYRIFPFSSFMIFFYIYFFSESINNSLLQYVRASGKIKLFASVGMFSAGTVLIGNIFFLVLLHEGIQGYLTSLIIADLVSCLMLTFFGRVLNNISFKINISLLKEMMKYSMPLIPNALMWWIMGVSDRYLVTYYSGVAANGLYAVANKIPNILNMVSSVFYQAWQMSAIEESNSENKSKFFSNIFNILSTLMLLSTSVLLVFLKIIMRFFVSPPFYLSWMYVPFLFLGVVFSSYSAFLGANYIALKKTGGVFRTSVIGAILNLIINIILIPLIGVIGASVSTMLAFAVIWILRIYDTKQFVTIKIDKKKLLINLLIIFIQIGILYLGLSYEFLVELAWLVIMIVMNVKDILLIISKGYQKFRNKYKGTSSHH